MITNRKSTKWFGAVRASAFAVAAVCLAGCHTTGYQKGDSAAANSQVAAMEVQTESRELDATISALNELVNQPADDAKPQYMQFSAALDRLGDSAKRATSRVNRMWQKRTAYFRVWDQEIAGIQDEDIRNRSVARKAEVSNQFDSTNHHYDEAQNSLKQQIDYLGDIRKALSTDLTRDGLRSVQPLVSNANESARKVQTALAQSAAELDALSARTSSFRVLDVK